MRKGYKAITMQDIADSIGISKNAVSLALSNKPGVSDDLRNTVIKKAEELGYKISNKNVTTQNKKILVLVPKYISQDKYFYYEVYMQIENACIKNEYERVLVIIDEEEEERLFIPDKINEIYAGVIVVGVFNKKYIDLIVEKVENVVFLDNYYSGIVGDYVLTANMEGTYEAVRYLADLGHKSIGFVGAIGDTSSLYDRWLGFLKGMHNCNLEVKNEFCITPSSELINLLQPIDELKPYINKLDKLPTAWITGNDGVAYSLINILREKGLDVPNDISVVGFDDIEFSQFFNPPLTTVRVPRDILAKEAVRLVIKKSKKKSIPKRREYYTELVVRGSSKQPRIKE